MKIEIKKDAIKTTNKDSIGLGTWVVDCNGAIGQFKEYGFIPVDRDGAAHKDDPMWKGYNEYVTFPDFAAACRWVADGSKPSDLYAIDAIPVSKMPDFSFGIVAKSNDSEHNVGDVVFRSGIVIVNMARNSGKVSSEDITIFPITVGDSITFTPEQEYYS